jgi:hypothetical protein
MDMSAMTLPQTLFYIFTSNLHNLGSCDLSNAIVPSNSLAGMFYGCINCISLNLTNLPNNITKYASFAHLCDSLTSVITTDMDISNVTTMRDMFKDVTLPTDVYSTMLENFATQSVKPNVEFNVGSSKYTPESSQYRDILTQSPNFWQIIDGGEEQ